MKKIFQNQKIVTISILVVVVLAILGSLILFKNESPEIQAAEWYNTDWLYRRQFTIDDAYVDADLTNFPIAVQFTSGGTNPYDNTDDNGADIRFTDNDGNLLDYEIESWDESGTSTVWVKVPSVASTTDTFIYMYYGNAQAQDAQDPENVWDDDFIMVQHLEESDIDGDSNDIQDSTSYENDGTTNGMVSGDDIDAQLDGGFDFDGNNDRVAIYNKTDSDFDDMSAISVCTWVKPADATDVNENLVTKWQYTATQDLGWTLHRSSANNAWRAEVAYNGTNSTDSVASTEDKAVGEWQYVCFTWTSSALNIYVGKSGTGFVENTQSISRSTISNTTAHIYFADQNDFSNNLLGQLDEVRVSKVARSAAWLKAEYYNGEGSLLSTGSEEQGKGPLSYWSFDEGYGQAAYDYASGGIDGELGSTSGSDTNDPTWAAPEFCKKGNCLKFDGTNDYVDFGYQNDVHNNSGSFTFSLWSRGFGYQDGVSHSDGGHAGWMGSSGSRGVAFGPDDTGESNFLVPSGASSLVSMHVSGVNDDSDWIHWAYVYDATNQLMILYKNGIEITRNDSGDGVPTSIYTGNTVTFKIGDRGDGLVNWEGFIDEVKYYNYARSADEIQQDMNDSTSASFGLSATERQLTDGLVGWWQFDEAASSTCAGTTDSCDETQFDNDGDWNGSADATTTAKFNRAIELNGTTDYVSIPDSDVLDITESITVAAWVNFRSTNSWDNIIGKRESSNRAYQLERHSTNNTYLLELTGVGSIESNTTITTGEWHHVVGTWDGIHKRISIYVDGELENTAIISDGAMITNNSPVNIGRSGSAGVYYLDGMVDDARIYNRAVSPQEVRHLYEWAPGPIAWWKFEDKVSGDSVTLQDSSGNDNAGTTSDANQSGMDCTITAKYGTGCLFDGADDYIDVSDADSLDASSTITIAFWAKSENESGGVIIGKDYRNFEIRITATLFAGYVGLDNGVFWKAISDFNVTHDVDFKEWNHFAYVINFTEDTITYYSNGIMRGVTSFVGLEAYNSTTNLQIGRRVGGTGYFDGEIDDIRLYNYARNTKQILEDMHAGRPNNPIAYWSFDEGNGTTAYDTGVLTQAGAAGNDGTLTNMSTSGTSTAWVQGKKGKALQFDGSDDYVVVSAPASDLNPRTGDFALSAWFKANDIHTSQYLISKRRSGWGEGYMLRIVDGEILAEFITNDTGDILNRAQTAIATSTWYMVTAVYDRDSNLSLYLNGELMDTQDISNQGGVDITETVTDFTIGNNNNLLLYFNGIIDEVKYYNYVVTLDEIRQNYNQGKQTVLSKTLEEVQDVSEGLVGWWKMDETAWAGNTDEVRDYSGLGNHGTRGGDATTTSTAKYGRAGQFDGTGDYIETPNIPTGLNWTVTAWFKLNNTSEDHQIIAHWEGSSNFEGFDITVDNANDDIAVGLYDGGGYDASDNAFFTGDTLSADTWYHVAVTHDYENNTVTVYRDGNFIGSKVMAVYDPSEGPMRIGAGTDFATYEMNGLIDDVKMYNYIRTPEDIMRDYVDGPPPVAHWKMDEKTGTDTFDASGFGNTGAITNATWQSSASCRIGACLSFDGSGDYVNIPDPSGGELDFGGGDFTLSTWVYMNDASIEGRILDKRGGSYSAGYGNSGYFLISYLNRFYFGLGPASSAAYTYTSNNIVANQWYHVVAGRNDGTPFLYVDGVEAAASTQNNLTSEDISSSNPVRFGTRADSVNNEFDGYIDDVKIWNYALTSRQIAREYNDGKPIVHYKFDKGEGETIYDYSGNSLDGTLIVGTGGTQTTTSTAWSNGASNGQVNSGMSLDGTDDYVLGESNLGISGDAELTMMAWVYWNDSTWSSNYPSVMGNNSTGVTGSGLSLTMRGGRPALDFWSKRFRADDALDVQTWYHVAVTKTPGLLDETSKIYINGEEVSGLFESSNSAPSITDSPPVVGRLDATRWFKGYIDEAKFFNYALTPEDVKKEYNKGFSSYFE